MGAEYINQKVLECLYDLIGEKSPENMKRLKLAALKLGMGVIPDNASLLGDETRCNYEKLSSEDFQELKENVAAYILNSQRDEGQRDLLRD
jgi:hypothetical protein